MACQVKNSEGGKREEGEPKRAVARFIVPLVNQQYQFPCSN